MKTHLHITSIKDNFESWGRGLRCALLSALCSLLPISTWAQEEIKVYDERFGKDEVIDIPEGVSMLDSLIDEFHTRNYLVIDESCQSTDSDIAFDRDTYIRRLQHLPNVMEMPYNEVVRQFIDRYTGRMRKAMPYLLSSANFYMPIFEEALEACQIPLELKYLPVIESALNPQATSKAGAGGLWQFMITTGKLYGLTVNSLIDERRDPIKSSYAAARYLRDLYDIFHDWTLVIAAYNCGPQNVNKAIKRSGDEQADYWKIYPYLPKETRGYVPAFIAANYAMNYYCEHGICPAKFNMPAPTDTVHVNRNLHFSQIVAVCNVKADEVKALNPQYRTGLIPGDASPCTLRLPTSGISAFIAAGDSVYNYHSDEIMPNRDVVEMDDKVVGTQGTKYHKVRKGDTLGAIAKKYRTSVKTLQRLNNMKGTNLTVGKRIRVK